MPSPSLSPTPLLHQATESHNAGSFDEALQYSRWALWCNVGTIVYSVVSFFVYLAVVIAVAVVNTSNTCDDYDYYC